LQLPPAHLAEAFDEFTGIMGCQFPGLVAELAEAALKIAGGGEDSTLPVRCGHCDQFPNLVDGEFAPQIAILGRQSLYGK